MCKGKWPRWLWCGDEVFLGLIHPRVLGQLNACTPPKACISPTLHRAESHPHCMMKIEQGIRYLPVLKRDEEEYEKYSNVCSANPWDILALGAVYSFKSLISKRTQEIQQRSKGQQRLLVTQEGGGLHRRRVVKA